jgi:hypothetical protein
VGNRSKQAKKRTAVVSAAVAGLGAAVGAAPADAATFTVTNLGDSGPGSLRQAIEDANGTVGADVVDFQVGLTGEIVLTTGQLEITDSVDVQGPGAATITVSGNTSSRVFYLYNSAALIDVTLSGMTIADGEDSIGGGIVVFDENLVLDQVTITDNTATVDGGGLWADGFNMNLTIRDSVISGNFAGDDGGGIYVEDTGEPLLIQRTEIATNFAPGSGAGIYFYDPDNDVTIEDSTISNNSAGCCGGGVYLYSPDAGEFSIRGTTISGNSAAAGGGGVFLYSPDHGGEIANSTISGNRATAGDGGGVYLYNMYAFSVHDSTVADNSASGIGGGIFLVSGELPLADMIVSGNTAANDPDLANVVEAGFDLAFSLVEDPGTANITDSGGNVFNQDPQLGPLADNGGPTATHLPATAGPAVNVGSSALVVDQRGLLRPIGSATDMGAVEVNPGTIELTLSVVSVGEDAVTVTVTATRTGGTDGAVSVSYTTADGTATSPDDFGPAAGTLNWATGDGASKSFQVTIVDDLLDEPDETFTATISAPTGGAALGATTTQEVTIVDNDLPVVVEPIPTLDEWARLLLAAVLAGGGVMALRRRRDLAGPTLALALAAGTFGASALDAAPGRAKPKEVTASLVLPATTSASSSSTSAASTAVHTLPAGTVLRFADGSEMALDGLEVEVKDKTGPRQRRAGATAQTTAPAAASGTEVRVVVRRAADGSVKRVVIKLGGEAEEKN